MTSIGKALAFEPKAAVADDEGRAQGTVESSAGGIVPPASAASTQAATSLGSPGRGKIFVWDLPVRVFHWSLVGLVATAWWSGGSGEELHEIVGYLVATLIIFRLGWGLVGTRHARFSDFLASPLAVLRYMRGLVSGKAERHLGHNPPGGMMILALIACLITVCATGIMQMTPAFFGIEWVENLHIWSADGILVLVPLHILGVIVSSWLHRENLVGAMITGDKAALPGEVDHNQHSFETTLLARIHASHGFVVLALMLAGGLAYGIEATSGRTLTIIASPGSNPAATTGAKISTSAQPETAQPETAEPEQLIVSAAPSEARLPLPARRPQSGPGKPDLAITAASANASPALAANRQGADMGINPTPAVEVVSWQLAALRRSLQSQQETAMQRPNAPSQIWRLARGGRLYGAWYGELVLATPTGVQGEVDQKSDQPKSDQPAKGQPRLRFRVAGGDQSCASCHGWSYDGVDEKGQARVDLSLRRQRGRNVDAIGRDLQSHVTAIAGASFGDEDLEHLALFLSKGQHEAERYISPSKVALGKPQRGGALFQSMCASCHGYDGKLIPPARGDVSGMGALAAIEPARIFHLIRNGHPGLPVPAMRAFPISDAADLLAYVQGLGAY